jgi:hypothetical protein
MDLVYKRSATSFERDVSTSRFEFSENLRKDADLLNHFGLDAELEIFQQLARLFSIDQLDLRRTAHESPPASRRA